jgi:hypothetical protein
MRHPRRNGDAGEENKRTRNKAHVTNVCRIQTHHKMHKGAPTISKLCSACLKQIAGRYVFMDETLSK